MSRDRLSDCVEELAAMRIFRHVPRTAIRSHLDNSAIDGTLWVQYRTMSSPKAGDIRSVASHASEHVAGIRSAYSRRRMDYFPHWINRINERGAAKRIENLACQFMAEDCAKAVDACLREFRGVVTSGSERIGRLLDLAFPWHGGVRANIDLERAAFRIGRAYGTSCHCCGRIVFRGGQFACKSGMRRQTPEAAAVDALPAWSTKIMDGRKGRDYESRRFPFLVLICTECESVIKRHCKKNGTNPHRIDETEALAAIVYAAAKDRNQFFSTRKAA